MLYHPEVTTRTISTMIPMDTEVRGTRANKAIMVTEIKETEEITAMAIIKFKILEVRQRPTADRIDSSPISF